MNWANRVRQPLATPLLRQAQVAARNLADQAGLPPGKVRTVFQTVADCAVIGTVCISGALAAVHLYKALSPRHKKDHPAAQPAGGNRSPPRRPGSRVAMAADDRGGRGEKGNRFR
ncbi:MAG: hypothetical protein ACRELG_07565 [Gemmataceae bacterium]